MVSHDKSLQNKRFCLHNMCVYNHYFYINTHLCKYNLKYIYLYMKYLFLYIIYILYIKSINKKVFLNIRV